MIPQIISMMVNMGTPAVPNWETIVYKSGWSLTGNGGTSSGSFLGTTDVQPLRFRVNDIKAGYTDTGTANTSFGFRTLDSVTTGTFNTALGYKSLVSTTTGSQNTAIGSNALRNNDNGSLNTAIGYISMQSNIDGGLNT